MSNSLWPHGLLHARLPCPSQTPGVYSDSCPSSQWCHPTIWSSVVPFSSCLQSFLASGSFPMSQLFPSGGQSIGVSASASYSNEYSGLISFRIDWLDLLSPRHSKESSPTRKFKSIFGSHIWHKCEGLYLGSLFYANGLCHHHSVLIYVALQRSFKSGSCYSFSFMLLPLQLRSFSRLHSGDSI